jgi:site-specific DNA-methyltransferase (cytosine-N4-specific)
MSVVQTKLSSVAWDFADAKTGAGPHAIHPYPAKFIPQIPRALIELFHPGDGSSVFDPFCGSGTTLVEAMLAGLPSVGVDVNPVAALVSKVKTTPVKVPLGAAANQIVRRARRAVDRGDVKTPVIPRVDHWFKKGVQLALAATIDQINRFDDADAADALRVALSSIIVRVSNQDSDTRYAAVEKDVGEQDVWSGFEKAAASVGEALRKTFTGLVTKPGPVRVVRKDLMTVAQSDVGRIGLVVTSPPYPNAYEYWLYHKYRMYWLGLEDPVSVRKSEIGARPHYFKRDHQTEDDFERQMGICFRLLAQVMNPGAYACFVVGRSIIHGREIDNEALLGRAAAPHGFRKVGSVGRTIAANRKSFNLSHGTINREGILVFAIGQS